MRTTLTLDPDVAALLERVQAERDQTFKETVNAALRHGLLAMTAEEERLPTEPFRTRTLRTGPRAFAEINNVAEVLAVVEREDYK